MSKTGIVDKLNGVLNYLDETRQIGHTSTAPRPRQP